MSPTNHIPPSVVGQTLLPSVLRTVVPIVYALLVRWGVVEWLDPDETFIVNAITALVTAAFYLLLRVAERHWDKIGWLLGFPQQPVYVSGEVLGIDKIATPPTTVTRVETDSDPHVDQE